jgi:hypothetical protein
MMPQLHHDRRVQRLSESKQMAAAACSDRGRLSPRLARVSLSQAASMRSDDDDDGDLRRSKPGNTASLSDEEEQRDISRRLLKLAEESRRSQGRTAGPSQRGLSSAPNW